ncbi:MAG TPA: L-threonylcarbamoyladenylate synthase [Myxococcaceae bacterium]|nr:L-threonylcarbamoyladenylate synthase [Myxococcaceae bacterium]
MSNDSRQASLVDRAVKVFQQGGLVAIPTETVYGLAADASNELAVRRIFAVKGRPSSHPLIVHVPDAQAAHDWAEVVPLRAATLMQAFWPGPLTLVLRRSKRALDAVTAGQDTVALRVPNHPLALQVLRAFGGGLAAPSANRHGQVSPTTAEHVFADLGDAVDLVMDGGPCALGIESTIVDAHDPGRLEILRPGGVSKESLEAALGEPIAVREQSGVRVPGALQSHYAPRAGVVVVERDQLRNRAEDAAHSAPGWVAVVSPNPADAPRGTLHLSIASDPAGFARELYAVLRAADEQGAALIVIAPPEPGGLGLAIRDRLKKASAPRPGSTDPEGEPD